MLGSRLTEQSIDIYGLVTFTPAARTITQLSIPGAQTNTGQLYVSESFMYLPLTLLFLVTQAPRTVIQVITSTAQGPPAYQSITG